VIGVSFRTAAAFDDTTLGELRKINSGSGFCAPPMTFEVSGKAYLAITSGPTTAAKANLVNTPELKDQRNPTVQSSHCNGSNIGGWIFSFIALLGRAIQ
jgi:hypothetical protein